MDPTPSSNGTTAMSISSSRPARRHCWGTCEPISETYPSPAAALACLMTLSIPSVTNVYGTDVFGTRAGAWCVSTNSGRPGTGPSPFQPCEMS
jgi:hypothetical protein